MNTEDIKLPVVNEPDENDLVDSSLPALNPKQQRFVHLYLSGQYKITEIAELLNMSTSSLRKWLATPEIKTHIEQIQQQEDDIVKQGIKALRLKALYKMGTLVDSPVDGIAYQAARDILDRTGHKAPTKQEVNVEIYTFEQQIKDVIKQSNYIEAEYEVKNDED